MTGRVDLDELGGLVRQLGVQTGFWDTKGGYHEASADALVAVARSLGAPVDSPDGLDELRHFVEAERARTVEPVVVGRRGEPLELDVRTDEVGGAERVVVHLVTEAGETHREVLVLAEHPEVDRRWSEGRERSVRRLRLDVVATFPVGYHSVTVELGGGLHPTTLVVAPAQVPQPGPTDRTWGVFAPLYSLRPTGSLGPTVSDLDRLGALSHDVGARVVATLPILATYLSQPFDPSPYAPVSQRFWNELYIDVEATPELASSERARALLEDPDVRRAAAEIAGGERFDHRRAYALVRPVLDELAATRFAGPPAARAGLDQWVARRPDARRYAAFRAATDRTGTGWHAWGVGPGRLPVDVTDGPEADTHLWAQWTMDRQLGAAAESLAAREQRLYLDLPVGTSGDGFDTWSDHDLYAWGTAVGAPPDDFFGAGQNWGFPPVNPMVSRAQGHRQFAANLRHHLDAARILRLDHVMGLHRLYWVPDGLPATEGVYVQYPAEELFAVLAVEAHRRDALVVGEDLGTVPDEVRHALDHYGILGMYVSQFRLPGWIGQPIPPPDSREVASIDTHDTPPFAAWWRGADVDLRRHLGVVDDDQATSDEARRDSERAALVWALRDAGLLGDHADDDDVLGALLAALGGSDAATVLVALDDLVLQTDPQNVPGTGADRPNWVRMLPCTLTELFDDPRSRTILDRLQAARLGSHERAAQEVR
ncbi:MAG TPA: 4-alpha-glucanotransferase [Acidimicrobiales bacterium]